MENLTRIQKIYVPPWPIKLKVDRVGLCMRDAVCILAHLFLKAPQPMRLREPRHAPQPAQEILRRERPIV